MPREMSGSEAVVRLVRWFGEAGADLPWRRTRDRYGVLVAEVMLQATPVSRVEPVYESWMMRWPTAESLASAERGDVIAAWSGLGYPRRARNLHLAAQHVSSHGWPQDLRDLPGVGDYTAAAIACFADEQDVLPIDVNIRRVLARRFPDGWPGTPQGYAWHVGQALMDFGREICTARAPQCESGCPLRTGCSAADHGVVEERTPTTRRQSPYEGSMRQRRGVLLRELAESGRVELERDSDAAATLVADGLARRGRRYLLPAR